MSEFSSSSEGISSKCCIAEGCDNEKYLNHPAYCRLHWERAYKTATDFRRYKQMRIEEVIVSEMKRIYNVDVVCERKISGTRYRPDMHFVNRNKCLILIEIDEHQHKGKEGRDLLRTSSIRDSILGYGMMKRMIMIRINPDSYVCNGEEFHCIWKQMKSFKDPETIITNIVENRDEFNRRMQLVWYYIASLYEDESKVDFPDTTDEIKLFFDLNKKANRKCSKR